MFPDKLYNKLDEDLLEEFLEDRLEDVSVSGYDVSVVSVAFREDEYPTIEFSTTKDISEDEVKKISDIMRNYDYHIEKQYEGVRRNKIRCSPNIRD